MYRLVATYKKPNDIDAFMEHYRTSHAVKTKKLPKLKGYSWGRTEMPDGSEPADFLVAVVDFENKDDFLAAMGSPEGAAANGDLELMPHNGFTMQAYEFES